MFLTGFLSFWYFACMFRGIIRSGGILKCLLRSDRDFLACSVWLLAMKPSESGAGALEV